MARRHGPQFLNLIVYKAYVAEHVMRLGAADSIKARSFTVPTVGRIDFCIQCRRSPDKAPCTGGVHRL